MAEWVWLAWHLKGCPQYPDWLAWPNYRRKMLRKEVEKRIAEHNAAVTSPHD